MPLVVPDSIRPLLDRPVAIFGAGVSGRGVLDLLRRLGARGVVYDRKGGDSVSEFTPELARRHGLVVFSPGFSPEHVWLETARAARCTCLGELDFASLFWRGRIVAITGTNGKTTLTEFLTHALRSAGERAYAVGNVGFPFSLIYELEPADDAIAVCEVSSFQAETLRHLRADATLWTNFAEDHLERHPGMAAYFDAKWRLALRTAPGRAWAGNSVGWWADKLAHTLSPLEVVATENLPRDPRLEGTAFSDYPQRENFALAETYWRASGRDATQLVAAARTFHLGRHRLARVAEVDGVTYWNDSKATNFHAVLGALARFDRPVLLIAGGKTKGGDIRGFAASLAGKVRHAFVIGDTTAEFVAGARAAGIACTACLTLADAVTAAAAAARPGDHVLLSPGFASFDMFRNYEDRGDQFEALVALLAAHRHPVRASA